MVKYRLLFTYTGAAVGIADKIYEAVKGLPDPEARKILLLVANLRAQRVTAVPAQRHVNLSLFRQYRGCYDGVKIDREAIYDRAGLR